MTKFNFTFTREDVDQYRVHLSGQYIGLVQKEMHWTVRGDSERWAAYRKGKCVACSETTRRKAALALLGGE